MQLEIFEEQPLVVADQTPTLKHIFQLQEYMRHCDNQLDVNQGLQHTFHDGNYAREMLLPKGMLIVGKVHKHAHINIVSRGLCIVWTTEGRKEIDATIRPLTFISEPGTKRVVFALEDTYWTTLHMTNHTDLAEIEKDIIIPESDFAELLEGIDMKQITEELS